MKIKLKQQHNKDGKSSLFLEYYGGYTKDKNGKLKLKRKYEFLGIWIFTNPKNEEERKHNKELLNKAEIIVKRRELDTINNEHDFETDTKLNTNFIDYYQKAIEKKSVKKSSYLNYECALMQLLSYIGNPDTVTFKTIDESFINGFMEHLDSVISARGGKLHNNSKHSYIVSLKSIVHEAFKEGIITKNPFLNIKNYSLQESKREYLTLEELQKLYNTDCSHDVIKKTFLFSCLTGLRLSDVHNLKWSMVIQGGDSYKIEYRQKKTNSFEYLPLNIQAVDLMGVRGGANDKVFKGLTANNTLSITLLRWARSAGINKHITFHSARHTFATLQLTAGADLYTVSKLLGHKNMQTTQIYAKIIDDKKRQAVDNFPIIKINS